MVQHKVEVNVAPINANGSTGTADAAALVLPEGDFNRMLQTFLIPGLLTSAVFLVPTVKLLFPSKQDVEDSKKPKPKAAPRGPGLFGGGGGPPGRGGGRGPGGLDPEQFAKSKAKVDLTPVTGTR